MGIGFWTCAGVALISAGVSLGYAIAGVRGAAGDADTPSRYALARSAGLVTVALIAPFTGSEGFVAAAAGLASVIWMLVS